MTNWLLLLSLYSVSIRKIIVYLWTDMISTISEVVNVIHEMMKCICKAQWWRMTNVSLWACNNKTLTVIPFLLMQFLVYYNLLWSITLSHGPNQRFGPTLSIRCCWRQSCEYVFFLVILLGFCNWCFFLYLFVILMWFLIVVTQSVFSVDYFFVTWFVALFGPCNL